MERAIEAIAGTHWGDAAQDRRRRQELSLTFLERFDVPWATGKQLALTDNLLPRSRRGPPTHGYCNCSGMMGPPDNVVMHPQGNRHQPHNLHTFPPSSRPQGGGGTPAHCDSGNRFRTPPTPTYPTYCAHRRLRRQTICSDHWGTRCKIQKDEGEEAMPHAHSDTRHLHHFHLTHLGAYT